MAKTLKKVRVEKSTLTEEEKMQKLIAQRKMDEKKVYKPFLKVMKEVINSLGKLELNIPIYNIARMDIDGIFSKKRHSLMRKSILGFLKKANKYRKTYWEFQKSSKKIFDKEMQKNGAYAPGLKEYESLRNQVHQSILDENSKAWEMSYDNYLPKIREHSKKTTPNPRNGSQTYSSINTKQRRSMRTIKKQQVQLVIDAQELVEDVELAMKNPEKKWRSWHDKTPSKRQ